MRGIGDYGKAGAGEVRSFCFLPRAFPFLLLLVLLGRFTFTASPPLHVVPVRMLGSLITVRGSWA